MTVNEFGSQVATLKHVHLRESTKHQSARVKYRGAPGVELSQIEYLDLVDLPQSL